VRNCGCSIGTTSITANGAKGPARARATAPLLIGIWALSAVPAMAEQPGYAREMDDLVVTATRLATPRRQLASSVTVITAEDIQRRQYRSVSDALRSVPGLHVVQTGGPGQQTSVFMRGANSNHTLVLIDGIEASDPSSPAGAVDFSNLWLDNVERIEIVRGPQSTLYGSDAIGGVIHISTRRGEGELGGTGKLEGGSDNTINQQASAGGATDRLNYSLGVTHIDTDGDSVTPERLRNGVSAEDDNYQNWTTSARLGIALNETLDVNFFARYIDSETDLDPELFDPAFGGGTTEDRDARLNQTEYLLRGEAKAQLVDGLWEATFSTSYTNYDRSNRNDRQSPAETLTRTDFDGDKLKFEFKNDFYPVDAHVLTLGLETEKENMTAGGFSDFGGFIVGEETDADARNNAVYAQDQFTYNDSLFGTIGLRYDDNDDVGSEFTYRVAPVYVHQETDTRIKASVGTGFKAPTLFQTDGFTPNVFGSFYRGNPDLDPEKSFGWEIGIEQALWDDRLDLGATYFKSDIDDLMQVVFDPSFNSTYENIDQADIRGVEAFMHTQPIEPLAVRVDYTWTDAEDDNSGEALLRRPKHKVDVDLELQPTARTSINLMLNYVADYKDISRETSGIIHGDDYAVLDIAAYYQLNKQWRIFGRIENVTDEHYEPADGFQASDRGLFAGAALAL
jgi:vitamin B12 transporter